MDIRNDRCKLLGILDLIANIYFRVQLALPYQVLPQKYCAERKQLASVRITAVSG